MTNLQRNLKQITWSVLRTRLFNKLRPRLCHIPVFHLEGKTKRSKLDFSAVVFASTELAEYFSKLSYAEEPKIKFLGKKTYHDISSIVKSLNPDVVFVEGNQRFSQFLFSNEFFVLPLINFTLDISDSWDVICSRMHRNKRNLFRKIKNRGFTYEITTDFEKFKLFYHEMYVTYILKRHGKSAHVVDFSECERMFRNGELLLVKLDGEIISGVIYVPQGDTLYCPIAGIRDVEKNLTIGGHAQLYFVILWAKQHGYTTIDYGSCKPFLEDGVVQHKKRLGMKLKSLNWRDSKIFGLKFCNFNEQTVDFLSDNPFIFTDAKNQNGLVLLHSYDEDLHNKYYVPGLSGLFVLGPKHNIQNAQTFPISNKLTSENNTNSVPSAFSSLMSFVSERGYGVHLLVDYTKKVHCS